MGRPGFLRRLEVLVYLKDLLRPMRLTKVKILLIVTFLFACFAPSAKADPLFFANTVALQGDGSTQVNLFSNPGVSLLGPSVNFLVEINGMLPPSGSDTLVITFVETGQPPQQIQFQIPLFSGLELPYSQLFSFNLQSPTSNTVLLTINILGSDPDFIIPGGPQTGQAVNSYTYSFTVTQPVPEPTSLFLVALGFSGVIAHRRRRTRELKRLM